MDQDNLILEQLYFTQCIEEEAPFNSLQELYESIGKKTGIVFKLSSADDNNSRINYTYKNKEGKVFFYCIQIENGQCILYRQTKDRVPISPVEPIGSFSDMFEIPTGHSELEKTVRDYIQHS